MQIVDKVLNLNLTRKTSSKTSVANSKAKEQTIEDFLPFDKVINDIVKVDDTMYLAVLEGSAIEFDDMDKDDIEFIVNHYGETLQTITLGVQIYKASYRMDIREQVEQLEQRIEDKELRVKDASDPLNEEVETLIDLYDHQQQLLAENNSLDDRRYIIIQAKIKPVDEVEDMKRVVRKLSTLSNDIIKNLKKIGVKLRRLNYEEIGLMYYYALNPFSYGIQEPDFSNDIAIGSSEDVTKVPRIIKNNEDTVFTIEKTQESTNYLAKGSLSFKNLISPYSIDDKTSSNYIKVGSTYFTVYEVYDYQKNPRNLWLSKLYNFRNYIDVTQHIEMLDTQKIIKETENKGREYRQANISMKTGEEKQAKTYRQKKMAKAATDMDKILDQIGQEDLFHFSMTITVKARSIDELDSICEELELILGKIRVLFRKAEQNMRNAFLTAMPFGQNLLGNKRNLFTTSLAHTMPFVNATFNNPDGVPYGVHRHNHNIIYDNPYDFSENGNGNVLGTSGSGKSVALKRLISQLCLVKGYDLDYVDPNGECLIENVLEDGRKITYAKSINAEVIDIFIGSQHKLNIFDVQPIKDVKSLIKPSTSFIKMFLSKAIKIDDDDKSKIDYALIQLYRERGFTDDKSTQYEIVEGMKVLRKPPVLFDLYTVLFEEKYKDVIGETKHIGNRLREWTRLGTNDLFDGYTNINREAKRTIYNLKHIDKGIKNVAMLVVNKIIWDKARMDDLNENLIVNEEASFMLRDNDIAEYLFDNNKMIRKYGGISVLSSQNVTDWLNSKWGIEILKNSSWSFLMKQKSLDAETLKDIFNMRNGQVMEMQNFDNTVGECYYCARNYIIPMNVRVSKRELRIYNTDLKQRKEYLAN